MAAIPDMTVDRDKLHQIEGTMPRLNAIPSGCAFNPRCEKAFDRCTQERPELVAVGATHAACWWAAANGAVGAAA
jgi:peptide/nickel transport system ATP-binding protein